jgi:hypothetical protein
MLNTNGITLERNCAADTKQHRALDPKSQHPAVINHPATEREKRSRGHAWTEAHSPKLYLKTPITAAPAAAAGGAAAAGTPAPARSAASSIPPASRRLQRGVPRAWTPGALPDGGVGLGRAQRRQESWGLGGGGEGAADATAETPGARASQFATEAESNSASLKKLRVR